MIRARDFMVISVLFGAAILTSRVLSDDTPSKTPKSFDALRAEAESLQVENVAWRGIDWQTCLIDGLRASREQHKPVILWVFIDRPIDDLRC